MTKNYKFLQFEEFEGIGVLTLNREDKLNALNSEVMDELSSFLTELKSTKLSGLIFTGAGEKAFIAGADIAQMKDMSSEQAQSFAVKGQKVTQLFEDLTTPVIAAVNGFALGGGLEMALACDFIICSANAVFALPEVSLGLIPGFGGTQRLAKIVGRNRAKELVYTGRMVKSDEAKEIGLVLSIHSDKEALMLASKKILEKVSRNSSHAIGVAKVTINNGVDLDIAKGLKLESTNFGKIFDSYDMKEGTKAFLEKRKPQFKRE